MHVLNISFPLDEHDFKNMFKKNEQKYILLNSFDESINWFKTETAGSVC